MSEANPNPQQKSLEGNGHKKTVNEHNSRVPQISSIEKPLPSIRKTALPKRLQNRSNDEQYYLRGFAFLILLVLTYAIVSFCYMLLHNIKVWELFTHPETLSSFGYIGGSATPFAIGIEVETWCLIGVICQMAYLTGNDILKKQFVFRKYLVTWISASLSGWGIALAVVFSLNIISISIGQIEITLANAPISVIIAISFILGFYNSEARNILGKLRKRLAIGMGDEKHDIEKNDTAEISER